MRDAEQGQLPIARPCSDLSASQPADRREEKPKLPYWPPPGQGLDNTNRFKEIRLVPFSGQLPQNGSETRERLPAPLQEKQ